MVDHKVPVILCDYKQQCKVIESMDQLDKYPQLQLSSFFSFIQKTKT